MTPLTGPFVPIWQVTAEGALRQVGQLAADGYGVRLHIAEAFSPRLVRGEHRVDYIPFFLEALRPGGYLGAAESTQIKARLGYAQPPVNWTVATLLDVLDRYGLDQPGNLFIGRASVELAQRLLDQPSPYPMQGDAAGLDRQADQSISHRQAGRSFLPGSGSLGEQPKMLACWEGFGNRPCLVKFSPPHQESAVGRRIADLLLCEAHCLGAIADAGIAVAETTAVLGARVHLLSRRFDWTKSGRLPMAPLSGVDMQFYGAHAGIAATMARLANDSLLPAGDAATAAVIDQFSALIGNHDRHMYNASLHYDAKGFTAAPQYDVLPMRFMPVNAEIPKWVATERVEASPLACRMAEDLKARVMNDPRISGDFRTLYLSYLKQQIDAAC